VTMYHVITTQALHIALLTVQLHQRNVKDSCKDLQKAGCLHNDLPVTPNLPALLSNLAVTLTVLVFC